MVEAPSGIRTYTSRFRAVDGLILSGRSWVPAESPRAAVYLVHGYAEHSGRYDELARHLCRAGIAVHTYDQRGAGRSAGQRGRIHRFAQLVDDLRSFLAQAPRGDVPTFLMGHSLGGAVALEHLVASSEDAFAGVIMSSPALRILTPFPESVEKLLVRIAPIAPMIPTLPLNRDGLSRDPQVIADVAADDGNFGGRILLGTAGEMIAAGPRILERVDMVTLPILIFVGTADPIVHPRGSFELYGRVSSTDKTLAIYEGLYHETFREPEKAVVMDGLRLWLEEQLAGR